MLTDAEYALVIRANREGMAFVEAERERRLIRPLEPIRLPRPHLESSRAMLEMYRLLTGWEETNPAAIGHHRISLYGPPCESCGKPLRTPRARFCAACTFWPAPDAPVG